VEAKMRRGSAFREAISFFSITRVDVTNLGAERRVQCNLDSFNCSVRDLGRDGVFLSSSTRTRGTMLTYCRAVDGGSRRKWTSDGKDERNDGCDPAEGSQKRKSEKEPLPFVSVATVLLANVSGQDPASAEICSTAGKPGAPSPLPLAAGETTLILIQMPSPLRWRIRQVCCVPRLTILLR
jgi:hypothetical protein